jgi:hypothetical protein
MMMRSNLAKSQAMCDELKKRLAENRFVFEARIEQRFNQDEYDALVVLLHALGQLMRNDTRLDKDLALELYSIPQYTRNSFLVFRALPAPESQALADKLEDAWIQLDALVMNCLAEQGADLELT